MADINQTITLGIGTPASIPYFILFGLGIGGTTPPVVSQNRFNRGDDRPFVRAMTRNDTDE